jgi:hypothetical protein
VNDRFANVRAVLAGDAPREFFRLTLWKPVVDEGARMIRERWRCDLEARGIETFEAKSGGMRALFRKGTEALALDISL